MGRHLDWHDDETAGYGGTLDAFQEQDELEVGDRAADGLRKEWVDGPDSSDGRPWPW